MASNVVDEPEMDIQPDLSDIDTSEVEKVSMFIDKGCGCKLGPKNLNVLVKEYSDSPTTQIQVIRGEPPNLSELPEQVEPKGLDLDRQWYLYEKIRPLCHSNLGRDLTCPKPSQPKPGTKTSESSNSHSQQCGQSANTSTTSFAGTKRRLCSVCHSSGHNKKTCPNKE